jgi:hypothetical protein
MNFQTRYITKDDFYKYWGQSLESLLGVDPNQPEQAAFANAFINQRETECVLFVSTRSAKTVNFDNMNEYQKEQWQLGILYYCYYVIKSGLVGMYSGINNEGSKQLKEIDIETAIMNTYSYKFFIQSGAIVRQVQRQMTGFGGYFLQ